ncbi:MAG: hypothetical protein LUD00_10210, partial [Prevotellaceae bacterium]|nr:hypothetical protein [Prevotellaceae bacterium]
LTRARGLGILTFGKIKKTAFKKQNQQKAANQIKSTIILSENNFVKKKHIKNFIMGNVLKQFSGYVQQTPHVLNWRVSKGGVR